VFAIKGNLIIMNNLYHKVVVGSVCAALGFGLGFQKKAYSATFTLAPTITFEVADVDFGDYYSFDGLGDEVFPGNFDTVTRGTVGETAEFAEFNIDSLSLVSDTIIKSAVFQAKIGSFDVVGPGVAYTNPGFLGIFGYVGNGIPETSDF
jgi:hypothetical protein